MGTIKDDVANNHLAMYPGELSKIKPFLRGFDITWARRRKSYNTEISVYFLKPEKHFTESFGFDDEILLAISDFSSLEPRSIQAIESFLSDEPARGRTEQSVYFIISKDKNSKEWISSYSSRNPQSRIPVVFVEDELLIKNDEWLIRNIVSHQLYTRDLFYYQLPINNDLFFFGRENIVAAHLDALKQSKNIGLFGLRKTGKTSILYKLKRAYENEGIGLFIYLDCKLPSIRSLRWHELLWRIITDISKHFKIQIPNTFSEKTVSDIFIETLKNVSPGRLISLVFDEIEYISPLAKLDTHWEDDFIPFWQTLWSAQSQIRILSNVIAGVNPKIAEIDTFSGTQNPIFGIIQPTYLKGFELPELRKMLRVFGRRMGMKFQDDSIEYLHKRYGGHPLLTRVSCSHLHSHFLHNKIDRPIEISASALKEQEESRDSETVFYCRHVVSELKEFYPDEYEMLELLSCGQHVDFIELSDDPDLTRHLINYGLLINKPGSKPSFAIPVIGKYIGMESARYTKRKISRLIIPANQREQWVTRRATTILSETRVLCTLLHDRSMPILFPNNVVHEPEKLILIKPCSSQDEFTSFINIMNKCFVEPIEKHGKSTGDNNYYWSTIQDIYPELWESVNRIKSYRHHSMHNSLTERAQKYYDYYIEKDIDGRRITQLDEPWFLLQQIVLDELLVGILCELGKLT